MEFITVNHSLNQTYHVEYNAIIEAVKYAVKTLKGYKLDKIEIKSSSVANSINIFIEVTFPEKTTYKKGAEKLTGVIEDYVSNLLDAKPKNIEIKINK